MNYEDHEDPKTSDREKLLAIFDVLKNHQDDPDEVMSRIPSILFERPVMTTVAIERYLEDEYDLLRDQYSEEHDPVEYMEKNNIRTLTGRQWVRIKKKLMENA